MLLRGIVFAIIILSQESKGHKEHECIEVGFARSAGSLIHQSILDTKENLISQWAEEDKNGKPSYNGWSVRLKNVTRTAMLLEQASKTVLAAIRKTRVGKKCRELWLLKGVEKHVVPLINVDKELAESFGLVMQFRCMIGSPYPNVDGSCVSEENPDFGCVGSKFLRLLPAYPNDDGFSVRGSFNKDKIIPNPRTISNYIRSNMKSPGLTEAYKEWGHFIQMDTFSIPSSPYAEGVDCCSNPDHVDCVPIFLQEDDPDYNSLKCINYKRAATAQAILGQRETFSFVSSYNDLTPLYGATDEEAFKLKTGYFGLLKLTEIEDLPKKECDFPNSFENCFVEDEEHNYVPGLKYLLALEHNRLCDVLAELNPHFDDSLLYNEARRIVIASYNTITYSEYLKVLLGEEQVIKDDLLPGSEGPRSKFIPQVNPGILNAFASVVYRTTGMMSEWRQEWGKTDFFSSLHYNDVKDDAYIDALAMDVQRSRDQAVPGYIHYRRFCDPENTYHSFEDLNPVFGEEVVKDLKTIYQDEIDDIDLSVGMLEPPYQGGSMGKTFTCLLTDQFSRLKNGNRLFWEHPASAFTVEQKGEITKNSAAALACRNLKLKEVPTNSFRPVSEENPMIKCSAIPQMDMSHWKDTSLIKKMKEKTGTQEEVKPGRVEKKVEKQEKSEKVMEQEKPEVKKDEL